MSMPYIIITSECLIAWQSLREKLQKLFSLSKAEANYLYNKTTMLFKGLAPEESIAYDYRFLLKRNLYEELYINIDTFFLRWIKKNQDKFSFVLLAQLKNFRAIFREHLSLFDKVFCSYEYNKHFSDRLFLKVIYSYAYNDVQDPRKIHIVTSFEFIAQRFKEIDYNVHIHLLDVFGQEKDIEKRKERTKYSIRELEQ